MCVCVCVLINNVNSKLITVYCNENGHWRVCLCSTFLLFIYIRTVSYHRVGHRITIAFKSTLCVFMLV